jgi:hypothetical protein
VLEGHGGFMSDMLLTIRFLLRFGFIDVDENEEEVKLSSSMFKFMNEIAVI